MKASYIALVLCFASLCAAQRASVEDAWALLAKKQRPQAIGLLQEIIKNDSQNADARLLLGSVLQEDGDRDGSIAQLNEAVRLRPDSADARNALGEAYNAFGDPTAARPQFEKAIALDARFAPAHLNLGAVLIPAGELDSAASHLDRAIALLSRNSDLADAHYMRAKVYTEKEDLQKAATQLEEAVMLRPDFAEAWSDLGETRKTLLDDNSAQTALEHAVALAPADSVAQTRLGSVYLEQGKAHLAVPHLLEASHLDPRNQTTLNSLQRALRQDGHEEQADSVRKKLAELLRQKDRTDQNLVAGLQLNNQGADLERAGDVTAALPKYQAAVRLLPEHAGVRANLAIALLRLGQWKDGLAELRAAVRLEPQNALFKAALEDALAQAPVEFGGRGQPVKTLNSGTKY